MQTIKLLLLTACILLGAQLYGQSKTIEVPDSLTRHYYNIGYQKISPNGRYVTFNKMYDRSTDTIMVVDRKNPDHIIFERGGVFANTAKFTTYSDLFMREGTNAQILSLPSLNLRIWKDVSDGFYHKVLKQIILLQNDTLKILNEEGDQVRTVARVKSIKNNKDCVYYTVKEAGAYRLTEWNGKSKKVLYTSENAYLDIVHRDALGIFVWDTKEKTGKGELIFKAHRSDVTSLLSSQFLKTIYRAEVSPLANGKYFLQVVIDQPVRNKNAVDVWYGSDPKIEAKFSGDREFKYMIWDPVRKDLSQIDSTEFTQNSFVGNARYLLSFDPYFKHDYTKRFKSFSLYRYDTQLKKYDFMINAGTIAFTDERGKLLLSRRKEGGWFLYNMETLKNRIIHIPDHEMAYFSNDGQFILFEGMSKIYQYSLSDGSIKKISVKDGFTIKVKNGITKDLSPGFSIFRYSYSTAEPVILELYDRENIRNALFTYDGKSVREIIAPTNDDITSLVWEPAHKAFTYVKSNINMPPQLIIKNSKKEELIFASNKTDKEAEGIKSEVISYTNSRGINLKGVLLYPVGFDAGKKYPMVVTIYQKLRYNMNKYLIDGIGMMSPTEGINVRTLLRKGYMVYMPDIVFDERGPGRAAVDCVNNAMDALQGNLAIDFSKVGLVGHSHGGYETNFIATQSNRFAAYVSGSGNSDLVRSYHSFNYNFDRPFYWQYEDGQYEMPGPFTENKGLYADNSPIYHAEKVTEPIMLWTGMEDYNIFWEQTMEFYLGLRRNHKHVTALFYPKEGHSLSKVQNRIDLYSRIYEWLDYHLKNNKQEWIEKMYK
ncbi:MULTISPECIES: S9 family peptidase [unclassified Kaistella]|uniref:alpha/beta hydrolase family protein n=1 Tax=unclassified Kaistella TaxID=2762626 RepID=UPI002734D544|nr:MULTISPECIES: prolyl oligopeptidase family serine peptidase [unclassified Kaistella]MDP2455294.1 prolyl oligopeptidase family serine peptidase [Kaistella sp. SH11-4b]MDP2458109.1 prolyl oligopeptidase family serine peptidase [Kaistella sp. SH40-3]MDP2461111.1 prolyl oligopeptidase family serine peptidase [Kaistella sp. SH19-2b]